MNPEPKAEGKKVLELFAGTCSFSKVAKTIGFTVFTSDVNPSFNTDYCVEIMDFNPEMLPFVPDIIWASPPCTTFSVASIGHHWTGGRCAYTPKTKEAEIGKRIVEKTIEIIEYYKQLNPKLIYFIENPRGLLRKMPFMQDFPRKTVTYCQYGDTRMKPTDIWTNFEWTPIPMCKNGQPCHEAAPRGAKTGTQGLKNARDRSIVPEELCKEILHLLSPPPNET